MGIFDRFTKKKKSYFPYVAAMNAEVMAEMEDVFEAAVDIYGIADPESGSRIAEQLQRIVEEILNTGVYPEEYEDTTDAVVGLGVLFGQALCREYGWKWMELGEDREHTLYSVVSPGEYFSHAPLHYIQRILAGENIGLDGKNDNTVLLLFRMLKTVEDRPQEVLHYPLS